jgi:ribosomal protein S6--L-glutamate ligase
VWSSMGNARLIVLHTAGTPPRTALQIIKRARELGLQAKYVRLQDLNVMIENGEEKIFVRSIPLDADVAIVRGVGGPQSIEEYNLRFDMVKALEEKGTLVVNPYEGLIKARDKLRTMITLMKNGVRVPETIVTVNIDAALHYTEKWGKVIVKPIIGSLGRGVMLIDNVDIAYNIYRQLLAWYQPLLIQKYYEKKYNRDLRVLVIDGEPVASYYRVAREGSFKTNVAQGGKVVEAKPSEEILNIAIKSTESIGLFYAGVDIMETDEGTFVLEVNASPNWKGALQLGIDPSKILVEKILKKLKR